MVTFYNQAVLLIFVICLPWNESMTYDWYDLLLNLLFGLGDTLGKSALMIALSLISAGDVSAISLNKPIPASIIACILLGESFDVFDGVLVVINCVGLVLIAESANGISKDSSNVYGVLCAFVALASFVFIYFVARVLARKGKANPSLLSFMAGWIGVALSSVYLALTNAWHFPGKLDDVLMFLGLGCSTIIHFYSLTKALLTENMMFVASGMSVTIPITYIYDALFTQHKLAWQNIVGALLTVSSTLLLFTKTSCKEE
ncbi:hypothetical protein HOLleu_39460 [Holothuria leucospilota]|uniref:EamA domain-containing protein n=1 Tax=Holothuria leucospilota TaxID=206669 RepID=A0A9Q1BCZ2_HOLLE|nr:hypothetical protein HOLleu_39460 [Holothuria leucospilota]